MSEQGRCLQGTAEIAANYGRDPLEIEQFRTGRTVRLPPLSFEDPVRRRSDGHSLKKGRCWFAISWRRVDQRDPVFERRVSYKTDLALAIQTIDCGKDSIELKLMEMPDKVVHRHGSPVVEILE